MLFYRKSENEIWNTHGNPKPGNWSQQKIALRIRDLCHIYGLCDRVPRPIITSDKRALNKRIVEVLAERLYHMELENILGYRLWEYRKAAWAIEDVEQDIGLVYRTMGLRGLQSIENIGEKMGVVVEQLIHEFS